MAAISNFGYDRASRHERLLSELTYEMLREEPGEDAHEVALDHCLWKTKHHNFADTEPKQIERLYDGLGDKMASLAQFDKQRALTALAAALIRGHGECDTLEAPHRILSMLYYASNSPVNATYTPGALARQLCQEQTVDKEVEEDRLREEMARQLYSKESDSEEGFTSGFTSGSDLSAWSGSEGASEDDGGEGEVALECSPRSYAPDENGGLAADEAWPGPWHPPYTAAGTSQPEEDIGREYHPGCLHEKVTGGHMDGSGLAGHLPESCTSQRSLCYQVICMLRGCKTPGPAFAWQAGARSFQVVEGVHVPELSPTLLFTTLQHFAQLGTIATRLKDAAAEPCRPRQHSSSGHLSPSWATFLACLGREMHDMSGYLLAMERFHAKEGLQYTLLQLRSSLQVAGWQLGVLKVVYQAAEESQGAASPHERYAGLLTCLHDLLLRASMQDWPQGRKQATMIHKLFVGTLRPCLEDLDAWLTNATLPSTHQEFFIRQDAEVGLEHEDFWEKAYRIKKAADGRSCYPAFLRPLVAEVLASGKALLLLRSQLGHRASRRETQSIHHEFVSSLQQVLQEDRDEGTTKAVRDKLRGLRGALFLEVDTSCSLAERMAQANCQEFDLGWAVLEAGQRTPTPASSSSEEGAGGKDAAQAQQEAVAGPQRLAEAVGSSLVPREDEEVEAASSWMPEDLSLDLAWPGEAHMHQWLQTVTDAMSAEPQYDSLLSTAQDCQPEGSLALAQLPACKGTVVGQLWGSLDGGGYIAGSDAGPERWLERLQSCTMPPAGILLETCLLKTIQARAQHTGASLLRELMGRWRLRVELEAMRNLYLGGAPLLVGFMHDLIARLVGGESLPDIPDAELQASLDACLATSARTKPLPSYLSLTVGVDREVHGKIVASLRAAEERRKAKEAAAGKPAGADAANPTLPKTLVELKALSVVCKMPWPLALVLDPASLQTYNNILTFLFQLRWAKEAVRSVQQGGGRNQGVTHVHGLAVKLVHMVDSLEQFVMYSLASAWQGLEQGLEAACSIQEVQEAHAEFLGSAAQPCMASPEASWHLIYSVLRKLLDICLHLHTLAPLLQAESSREWAEAKLGGLQADFADRHRYLLKFLSAKSLKIGGKSGLHNLLMRLDFNGYYTR